MTDETGAQNRLGIDQSSLGKLKPKDLSNTKTAAMALSYLASVEAENAELKTKNETLGTYVASYNSISNNARISAGLSLLSTIAVGFGINILTGKAWDFAGCVVLGLGIVLQAYAIYLGYKK